MTERSVGSGSVEIDLGGVEVEVDVAAGVGALGEGG
jgi:hypothetical protein